MLDQSDRTLHVSANTSLQTLEILYRSLGSDWQLNIRTWASKTLAPFFRAIYLPL